PHALLFAGISALKAGDPKRAVASLEELVKDDEADPLVRRRGQLFYGIALGYLDKQDRALAALAAGAEAVDGDDPDERASYQAALARASAATGHSADAVVAYDAWYPVARAAEKAYVMAQLHALVDGLADADVAAAWKGLRSKDGPG